MKRSEQAEALRKDAIQNWRDLRQNVALYRALVPEDEDAGNVASSVDRITFWMNEWK